MKFRFDSDVSGFPIGVTMDLWHEYEGDLSIFVEACGQVLNIMQRPGATDNCDAGCSGDPPNCGSPIEVGTQLIPAYLNFYDNGPDPENGISAGGDFGLTTDDACMVSTLGTNSFTELWSNCPDGLIEADICFADHAYIHRGFVYNLDFIFPNSYTCGCLDPDAVNYDSNASVNNGTECIYDCPLLGIAVGESSITACGGDTIQLSVVAPLADTPTFGWFGTGNTTQYLSSISGSTVDCILPADFSGNIQFTVTATDRFGCQEAETITVNVTAAPVFSIEGINLICQGDSTYLTAPVGFVSYLWNTQDTSDTIHVAAGAYSVTVSDGGECPGVANFTVDAQPLPTPVIVGPDTLCFGQSAFLQTDTSFVTWHWSTGDTTAQIPVDTSGTYAVTVTDELGCAGNTSFQTFIRDSLPLAVAGSLSFCIGDSVVLTATDGFDVYSWNTGDTTQSITVTEALSLQLTVTDTFGCQAQLSIQTNQWLLPEPQITGATSICEGQPVVLAISDDFVDYEWQNGSNASSIITDTSGLYAVTVTDANGCSGAGQFLLPDAPFPVITLQGTTTVCPGDTAMITALSDPGTYVWSNGATGNLAAFIQPGDYALSVTNQEGCTSMASVSIFHYVPEEVAVIGDSLLCPGEGTILSGTPGFVDYQWSSGTMGMELWVTLPGDYILAAIDNNGCASVDTIAVAFFEIDPLSIFSTQAVCIDSNIVLGASAVFADYHWSNGSEIAQIQVANPGLYSLTVTDANGCVQSADISVVQPIPTPVISGDLAFCEGVTTQLMVADTFANYQWSNMATESAIQVVNAGTYSLTVTDQYGCTATANVPVQVFPTPTAQINGNIMFCEGQQTTLTPSDEYAFWSWNVSGFDQLPLIVSSDGTYSLTVTDANGCADSTSVTVSAYPLPAVNIEGAATFCPGDSTLLIATTGFDTYTWNAVAGSDSLWVTVPGVYELEIMDANLCTATTQVVASMYPTTTPNISGELQFCEGSSTVLTASDGFLSYDWSTGATTSTVSVQMPGNIMLMVTDTNGCQTQATATTALFPITPPILQAPEGVCEGTPALLEVIGGYDSYAWSTSETVAAISVDIGGVYVVTVTDNNQCTYIDSISLDVFTTPTPIIEGDAVFCNNTGTLLTVGGGDFQSYVWSENSQTASVVIQSAGLYHVTVTDGNQCVGVASIIVQENEVLMPSIEGQQMICPGDSTLLTAAAGFTDYTWSDGSTSNSIWVSSPGTYFLEVGNNSGCTGLASIDIAVYSIQPLTVIGTDTLCAGETTYLQAGMGFSQYTWNTGETSDTLLVMAGQSYSVTATDVNGCLATVAGNVVEQPLPDVQLTGGNLLCEGDELEIATNMEWPFYLWHNGATSASIVIDEPGEVSVTVTDSWGCTNHIVSTIEQATPPIAAIAPPDTLNCFVESITLQGASDATQAFFYWQGPDIDNNTNDPSPVVSIGGGYSLVVLDEQTGCVSDTVSVLVQDDTYLPQVLLTVSDTLDCLTPSVAISSVGSDVGEALYYEWLDAFQQVLPYSGQTTITVYEPQQYTLLITDTITGCSNLASIDVSDATAYPQVDAGEDQQIDCLQETVWLQGQAASTGVGELLTQWQSATGTPLAAEGITTLAVNSSGWYYFLVTNSENGCASMDSVWVSEDALHPNVVLENTHVLPCDGNSIALLSAGTDTGSQFIYQWFYEGEEIPSSNMLSFATASSGLYTLFVTNENNGCTALATTQVIPDSSGPSSFTYVLDPPTCKGDMDGWITIASVEGDNLRLPTV
ncbi:MAG: hypothetical protein R2795_18690 [Saprospiraceae bacterium]